MFIILQFCLSTTFLKNLSSAFALTCYGATRRATEYTEKEYLTGSPRTIRRCQGYGRTSLPELRGPVGGILQRRINLRFTPTGTICRMKIAWLEGKYQGGAGAPLSCWPICYNSSPGIGLRFGTLSNILLKSDFFALFALFFK